MNFVNNSVHVFQAGAETTCQFPQNCLASVLRQEIACIAHKRSYTSEIVFHLECIGLTTESAICHAGLHGNSSED